MSERVPHCEAHRAEPEEAERNKKDGRPNSKPNQQHQYHIDR